MLDPSLNAVTERFDWAVRSTGIDPLWSSWRPTEWGYHNRYRKKNRGETDSYIHGYVELCGRGYKTLRVTVHEFTYRADEHGGMVRIPISGYETQESLKDAEDLSFTRLSELLQTLIDRGIGAGESASA